MDKVSGKLTVYFEDPFWIGVFEIVKGGRLSASKVTFGAEPKDSDVYKFVLRHYDDLRYSPAVKTVTKAESKNPKRIQREVRKQMKESGIGTKSQQALKLQQEQFKTERKTKSREQKLAESLLQYEMRKQKKKEKHKGH